MGSFFSDTKEYHDGIAFTLFFGGLFCVIVPLFIRGIGWHRWRLTHLQLHVGLYLGLALLGILVWFCLGLFHDGHLVPQNLHPNWWVWPRHFW